MIISNHLNVLGNYKDEIDHILRLGIYFSELELSWWWLAKQLLIQASQCAENYRDDGGRMEALCRYVLGKFFLTQCIISINVFFVKSYLLYIFSK